MTFIAHVEVEINNVLLLYAGVVDVPVLDASAGAAGLARADVNDPALRASSTHIHARATYAQSRLRTLQGL